MLQRALKVRILNEFSRSDIEDATTRIRSSIDRSTSP